MGRDDRARKVQIKNSLELCRIEVKEVLVRANGGTFHVSTCCIEKGVNATEVSENVLPILFYSFYIHDISLVKLGNTAGFRDVVYDGLPDVLLSAKNGNLCAILCEILGDATAEYTGSACDDYNVVFNVE